MRIIGARSIIGRGRVAPPHPPTHSTRPRLAHQDEKHRADDRTQSARQGHRMISVDDAAADDAAEECTKDAGWHRCNDIPTHDALQQRRYQDTCDCPDQIVHRNYGVVGADGCSGDAG